MKKLIYLLPVVLLMYACGGGGLAGSSDNVLASADDSLCYAIGAITANNFKDQGLNLNSTAYRQGFDDAAKDAGYLTKEGLDKVFAQFSMEMQMKGQMKQMNPGAENTPFMINVDTLSYAMGMDLFSNIKDSGIDLNSAAIYEGNADAYTEAAAKLTDDQIKEHMEGFSKKMQAVAQAKQAEALPKNIAKGVAFLAEKEKEADVKKTESGLLYKVVKQGSGPKPKATDKVEVHYHGTLIDGTVFDSSVDRGEPIEFPLNRVIPGWTEGVQLMPKGSKFTFYIPYNLAYGERGSPPKIEPGAALVFDVELLDINKPAKPK